MTVNIKGITINYNITGSGDYIFLLHGWGCSLEVFTGLAKEISKRYTVVSFDFPGFGNSPEPPEVWSVSDYAALTVDFIKSFACKSVILLGHSFGGRVIIKMHALGGLPFEIKQIILVDSAGILPKRTIKYKIKVRAYKTGKRLLSFAPVKKLFPNALENYKKKMGSSDYSNASAKMRSILVKTVNEDLQPYLKNIKAQTLLIWGENDTATPVSDGEKMQKAISGAGADVGLVVLKGAGHYSFTDSAYTFNKVLKSFLKAGE